MTFDYEAAADSIGEDLFGKEEPEEAVVPPTPAQEPPTPAEPAPAADDAPSTPPGDTPPPAPAPTPTDAPSPAPEADITKPPASWRAETHQHWSTLPEPVRQEVLRREANFMQGLEAYKGEAAFGRHFAKTIAPFQAILQQEGIQDPAQAVHSLLSIHQQLRSAPAEQKTALFRQLAEDYGVSLEALDPTLAPYVDPTVKDLQAKYDALHSQITQSHRAQEIASQQQLQQQITAFASAPENKHFNAVAGDMEKLLLSGAAQTLKDAYDKAVWANPAIRQQLLAEEQSKQRAEAAKAAEEAKKKASASVRTSPKPATATTAAAGSVEDTLKETLAAIRSRT